MDAHLLKVNISVMQNEDAMPLMFRREFENESRHAVIHETRNWIRETLARFNVQDDVNPLKLERATAGIDWNLWFYADHITIKLKVTRQ